MAKRQGIALNDHDALERLCAELKIAFVRTDEGEKVLVNDQDVSDEIRTLKSAC